MDWARHGANWPHVNASRFVLCKPHKWHVQEMGEGPLLLLIHGAGGATQSWRHLAPILARDFRVVMIDLPGQGFTKLGAQSRCGLEEMSTDLRALMMQEGLTPKALIGHSAGAAIALRMAEDLHPAPLVIGINAALGNFKGLAGVLFPIMAKTLANLPFVAEFFTASTARPKSVERLIDGTGSVLPASDRVFYEQLVSDKAHVNATLKMMAQWDLDPILARLDHHPSQTLLITGDKDRAVPPDTSAKVAKRVPNAAHVSLPNLGHLAHEEDAVAVAEPLLAFLKAS
ncbi:alpha/beta fold hydrolase BchO [Yoonia sp. 208BN28-4]|uniref:alpha/beta fold hydrolase BchO n=1 Tax=Yoonia sp. 208BN28-4 TaxID=3126505 RepID=UPI0030B5562C